MKLVIVDDDPIVRESLGIILDAQADIEVVAFGSATMRCACSKSMLPMCCFPIYACRVATGFPLPRSS